MTDQKRVEAERMRRRGLNAVCIFFVGLALILWWLGGPKALFGLLLVSLLLALGAYGAWNLLEAKYR